MLQQNRAKPIDSSNKRVHKHTHSGVQLIMCDILLSDMQAPLYTARLRLWVRMPVPLKYVYVSLYVHFQQTHAHTHPLRHYTQTVDMVLILNVFPDSYIHLPTLCSPHPTHGHLTFMHYYKFHSLKILYISILSRQYK